MNNYQRIRISAYDLSMHHHKHSNKKCFVIEELKENEHWAKAFNKKKKNVNYKAIKTSEFFKTESRIKGIHFFQWGQRFLCSITTD